MLLLLIGCVDVIASIAVKSSFAAHDLIFTDWFDFTDDLFDIIKNLFPTAFQLLLGIKVLLILVDLIIPVAKLARQIAVDPLLCRLLLRLFLVI